MTSAVTEAFIDRPAEHVVAPVRRPRLTAVPTCEPPFDDEPTSAARRPARRAPAAPFVPDWTVPRWSRDPDVAVARTPTAQLPPALPTAGLLARALVEVLGGTRSIRQLAAVCAPEVFAALGNRVHVAKQAPRLMSVRASEPADGVVEASAVFRRDERVAALAFRLQGVDGRWRVTAVQIG